MKYKVFILLFLVSFNLLASQSSPTKRVHPKYPTQAVKEGLTGCVAVQFFVTPEGKTQYVEATAWSSNKFIKSAVEAVSKWQYEPSGNYSRTTTQLTYSLGEDIAVEQLDSCQMQLSNETNDINLFRQQRLNQALEITTEQDLNKQIRRWHTVLSNEERVELVKQYRGLTFYNQSMNAMDQLDENLQGMELVKALNSSMAKKSKQLHFTLPILLNGNNYEQFMKLPFEIPNREKEPQVSVNKKGKLSKDEIQKLTPYTMADVYKLWDSRDMTISLESSLYTEITEKMLIAELLIYPDGKAELIDLCRDVSPELEAELKSNVADWQITSFKQAKSAVRVIYSVPAPSDSASYYQCDAGWFSPQVEQIKQMHAKYNKKFS